MPVTGIHFSNGPDIPLLIYGSTENMVGSLHHLQHCFWIEYFSGHKKTNAGKGFSCRIFFVGILF